MSILIVHTASASRRPHLARMQSYAKAHGERLLLLMHKPTWEGEYADRVITTDTTNAEETLRAVRDLVAGETEPIRGVTAFTEFSVSAAAMVAAELGVRFISERTAHLARDKYSMRTAFAAHAIPQPEFGLARTVDEALAVADRIGYPLVLKPVFGGGSKYVWRVDDPAELGRSFEPMRTGAWDGFGQDVLHRAAFEEHEGGLLLEGFVPGTEISVESVVVGGRTQVVAVHDRPLPMDGPHFAEVFCTTPTTLPDAVLAEVERLTAVAHEALGVEAGVTHSEFRVDHGRPRILETAARLGGGAIYRSVALSTGVDLVDAALDVACGRVPDLRPREPRATMGVHLAFARRPGRVTEVRGVDRVRSDPQVREVEIFVAPGDWVDVPPHVTGAHAQVLFTADDREGVQRKQAELADALHIETE
ncbi:ATP-grasp domain-containing protein [Streptomyces sp. NPDC051105]|uniref:ATP-grasp domain-containing protein n=1 Tax=Streptomyces sp. NPDC051105 TaxID=3154843 RepID=UPI003426BDD9